MYVTRIASAVRLRPGGQALVVTDVMGQVPDDITVLIEGLPELDANVKIARTLCTVHEGKVVVEVCNASTEDLVLSKGGIDLRERPDAQWKWKQDDLGRLCDQRCCCGSYPDSESDARFGCG
ncbi:hypothetical protein PF005_g20145 [Phytophthora fragariae]|uniref:Uncharacterized protein n=1 Tax=Phytophthora fragariae TaxID=53985 RepID=A0A6A3XH02_9STRA|nr:hypothetical protein PF005_g20145 [Phytophthora fragariae]KAE9202504.1 hypothetical protein PF002_g21224 [Phytophthora fragariae]